MFAQKPFGLNVAYAFFISFHFQPFCLSQFNADHAFILFYQQFVSDFFYLYMYAYNKDFQLLFLFGTHS